MGKKSYLEKCNEAYEQLQEKSKGSMEDFIAYLLESKIARIVCGLENGFLPEGFEKFELNDIQKKQFRDTNELLDEIKSETNAIIEQQEEEHNEYIEKMRKEEESKIKTRRLEYFTKNEDIVKLPLPNGSIEETIFNSESKFCDFSPEFETVATKINDIQKLYYSSIKAQYEKFMNEALATIILPHFTNIFTTQCLYAVFNLKNPEDNTEKEEMLLTITPYLLSNYETVKDFLQEYNGEIYDDKHSDDKYGRLRDNLNDLVFEYTEQFLFDLFFAILEDSFNIKIKTKLKDDLFAEASNCLLPYDSISMLAEKYCEQVEDLDIFEMFSYYDLKDQKENYQFCLIDEKGFKEEKKQVDLFMESLKTKTPKEIIMFDGKQFFKFYIDSSNNIVNEDGTDVENTVKELLWEIGSDVHEPSTLFVHEITPIKSADGTEQRKVSGLVIKDGLFYPITKESIKESYEKQADAGAIESIKGLRFNDWYFKFIPSFHFEFDENSDE